MPDLASNLDDLRFAFSLAVDWKSSIAEIFGI